MVFCTALSRIVTFTVLKACIPAPHSHSHHYQCRTPFAAVLTIVLLMIGIMMPETCWDNLIINIRLVASCWSLSLHPKFMMHGHKSLKSLPLSRRLTSTTNTTPDHSYQHKLVTNSTYKSIGGFFFPNTSTISIQNFGKLASKFLTYLLDLSYWSIFSSVLPSMLIWQLDSTWINLWGISCG